MLQRLFAFTGFAAIAALAVTIAGCGGGHVGSTAASSAFGGKPGLLPMRLDVSGDVVANKGLSAGYHQYWRYDAVPTACDKADGASNTYDVRDATFTVGARNEHFANLYFVRCQAVAHAWQGGLV